MNLSLDSVSINMNKPPAVAVSFLLFLCFQMLFTIQVTSYSPVDDFAVLCGGSGNPPSVDQRNWTGDNSSTRFTLIDHHKGTLSVKAEASMSKIPYTTARISRSEFSYSFPVTVGQKFIRLYFYPFSYNYSSFLRYDALFSVKAGSHTLIKDFNASLNADDASVDTIMREYLVNVDQNHRNLTVTFTPSLSHPNAYAFINGIEVVSMPDYLYYTDPYNLQAMMLNGGTNPFPVGNSSALQTMYRINVGGKQIAAEHDTGMFRNWDQDVQYLEKERQQSLSSGFSFKNELDYRDYNPNYTAPEDVYLTARNYGNEASKYNVTWKFQVDSNFTYMVRLHFCEFDEDIKGSGERAFQIFIADNLVEDNADVVLWTTGNLIPIHKDYAVSMWNQGSLKKVFLSIKLQPDPTGRSTYRDVLLNGVEILKINDSDDNLGGANPDPPPSPMPPLKMPSKNTKKMIIFSIVGSCAGFAILSLVLFLIFRRLARGPVKEGSSRWGEKSEDSSKKNKSHGSSLPSDLCRYFSIDEIRAATRNFDDIFIVGVGGFCNVYKGYVDDGTVPVAIKRLKKGSQQGLKEFQTEIEMLSQLRHRHLVSLIGYCNERNEMILVYEFMARGTLRDHIHDCESEPLSWEQRLEMCLGAARGLHYLHTSANHKIIHRDVKPTNILIDEKWVAKVSDFGLSKMGPIGMSKSHISTVVKGSIGYLDPEYYKRQRLTEKSDIKIEWSTWNLSFLSIFNKEKI